MRRTSRSVHRCDPPPATPAAARGRRGAHACASRAGGLVVLVEEGQIGSPRASSQRPPAFRPSRMTARSEGTAPCDETGLMDTTDELPAEVGPSSSSAATGSAPRLGAGGFGTVYAATDERLQRPVAVKVIPSGGRGDPTAPQREALAAGRLDHPGIVAIFDAGQDARARYLVSELVHGRTLDELERRRRAVRPRRAADRPRAVRRARARARPRRRAPRRQAAERDHPRRAALGRRRREAGRLRRRPPGRRRAADAHRRRRRHAGLHGARAGRRAAGRRARRPLQPRARALRGARGRQPGPRRLAGRDRAPRRHRAPAAARARARTCRRSCAPRSTARCARARGARHARRSSPTRSRTRCPRSPTRAAPSPATRSSAPTARRCRAASPASPRRVARRRPASPAALAWTGQPLRRRRSPPCSPSRCCRALGWLATAAAAIVAAGSRAPAARALVAAAARAAPVPLLLRRRGTTWSVPALAPLLGLAGLAGAYPALAGRARGWFDARRARRARRLVGAAGRAVCSRARDALIGRRATATRARVDGVARAARRGGALLYAAVWALAALLLPWLVRGRWLALDVVAASAWAAALGAGDRRGRRGDRRCRSRADSCSLPSSPACSRSRYHTSVESRGGAVTPGRILCTRNHGHHFPVAARERPAQP